MTSEILILNKENIALASDTRITVNDEKTFDGADKIFQISNKPPMAMMIYGKPNITGVPFETTLLDYKQKTNFNTTNTTNKIMKDFIKFMEKYANKYGEDTTDKITIKIKKFEKKLTKELQNNTTTPIQTLENIINESDLTLYNLLKEKQLLNKIPKTQFKKIANKYFKNENTKHIQDLLIKSYLSGIDGLGIVIAGFNENTIYPSYSSYKIFGKFDDEILYKKIDEKIESKEAQIISFAQNEIINSFLHGIDEETLNLIENFTSKLLKGNLDLIEQYNKEKIKSKDLNNFINSINLKNQEYLQYFFNLLNYNIYYYFLDILDSVDSLPKKDFSELAEFFIRMSSFKYKLTSNQTTVGEDINVALVSKKTGFQWMKYENLFK